MRRHTLAELRKRYVERGRALPTDVEEALRSDPRPGAQAILAAVERRRYEHRSEGQRLRKMLRYEQALWATGVERIAGVDEAGMSPLAGPVAAAAVILAPGTRIRYVDDSKKIDAAMRTELAEIIRAEAVAWCVAFAEPEEIDRLNIYWAGLLAMRRAVDGLRPNPDHVILDARLLPDFSIAQQKIVKGDERSLSIAAASILAKTARDARMRDLSELYPGYGFERHKGYPVKEHVAALQALGACPVHRRSFAPVRQALGLPDPETTPEAS